MKLPNNPSAAGPSDWSFMSQAHHAAGQSPFFTPGGNGVPNQSTFANPGFAAANGSYGTAPNNQSPFSTAGGYGVPNQPFAATNGNGFATRNNYQSGGFVSSPHGGNPFSQQSNPNEFGYGHAHAGQTPEQTFSTTPRTPSLQFNSHLNHGFNTPYGHSTYAELVAAAKTEEEIRSVLLFIQRKKEHKRLLTSNTKRERLEQEVLEMQQKVLEMQQKLLEMKQKVLENNLKAEESATKSSETLLQRGEEVSQNIPGSLPLVATALNPSGDDDEEEDSKPAATNSERVRVNSPSTSGAPTAPTPLGTHNNNTPVQPTPFSRQLFPEPMEEDQENQGPPSRFNSDTPPVFSVGTGFRSKSKSKSSPRRLYRNTGGHP
ncbi:unnamed protein product [Cylindrotheca closterium]|uniref:Uncharacterized protein n=1 Tax=Cylindrotheca closterium TaxID=2856 RepID=A0AAD2JJ96_9STRA|nr:unnamed protein product [Cylindrotheca closterium]